MSITGVNSEGAPAKFLLSRTPWAPLLLGGRKGEDAGRWGTYTRKPPGSFWRPEALRLTRPDRWGTPWNDGCAPKLLASSQLPAAPGYQDSQSKAPFSPGICLLGQSGRQRSGAGGAQPTFLPQYALTSPEFLHLFFIGWRIFFYTFLNLV